MFEEIKIWGVFILAVFLMLICWINLGGIGGFYILNVGFVNIEDQVSDFLGPFSFVTGFLLLIFWIFFGFLMIGISFLLPLLSLDYIKWKRNNNDSSFFNNDVKEIYRILPILAFILLCVLNFLIDVPWNIEGGLITIN